MLIAITRQISPNIGQCQLTHLPRQAIDVRLAEAQHRCYENNLTALGCQIHSLPAEPDLPDAVFVEDTALVLDELAIVTRPGAAARRPETISIAEALKPYRRLHHIAPPGTLDGGDVLRVDRTLFVGLSSRSNRAALAQLQNLLVPLGYTVQGIKIRDCLHLKSAVTKVARNTLLINPAWIKKSAFQDMNLIEVHPDEPFAGNALLVGEKVLLAAAFPGTQRRLEKKGITVQTTDVSELAKAEGGVTCCSLIFTSQAD